MRARASARPSLLKRALACLVSAAMCIAFTPVVAWGAEGDVRYQYLAENGIWKNGSLSSGRYTPVSSSNASWGTADTTSWYVVDSNDVAITDVTFTGDVRLVLAEGCTLNVNGSLNGGKGNSKGSSLTIYGQARGTGALVVKGVVSGGEAGPSGNGGNVTIYGGAVTAEGGITGGTSFDTGGSVAVYGGTVTAGSITGGTGRIYTPGGAGGDVAISGGTVTVTNDISGGAGGSGGGIGDGGAGGGVAISGGTVTVTNDISGGAGGNGGGFRDGGAGGDVFISGGTVTTASSISGGAGGDGNVSTGGSIIISGGMVKAAGNIAAGIGSIGISPSSSSAIGNITISGGFVTTEGIIRSSLNTGADGSAVLFSESEIIYDFNRDSWAGLVFEGVSYDPLKHFIAHDFTRNPTVAIYGCSTISENGSVVVGSNAGLVVLGGATLINKGTITNRGTLTNNGSIYVDGALSNSGTVGGSGAVYYPLTLVDADSKYSVTGGISTPEQGKTYGKAGSTVTLQPAREGYSLQSWSVVDSDSKAVAVGSNSAFTMPSKAMTVVASWTINQYTITFESNAGSPVTAITQNYGTNVIAPAPPTKAGCTFAGWYSDVELTQPYSFTTMPAADITLYAKWVAAPEPDPGPAPNPSPVTPPVGPEPATGDPQVGDKTEGIVIGGGGGSSEGSGGAGEGTTAVDITVTDTTPGTDSQGNKVDGTVSVGNIESTAESVAIPETITTGGGTFLVTEIPAGAMAENSTATTVTIPDSVTSIGEGAFQNCTELTSVSVPSGVTTIEQSTFAGCTSLQSVEIKGEATEIASNAFAGCESLTSVTIPAGATVGDGAFAGCTNLTSVTIPPDATIGENAFAGTGVTQVTIAKNATVGEKAFANSGLTQVKISGSASVGRRAFQGCEDLTKATLGKGLKTLPAYMFKGCTSLKSVTVPSTVTKLERSVFSGCDSLKSVKLPKSVKSIGKNAFYGADKVKKLTVSSTQLTKKSVADCLKGSSVTTVYVPKSKLAAYKSLFSKQNCGKKVTLKPIG